MRQITEKKHSGKLSPDKAKKYSFPDLFNKFINKHLPVNASNPQLTNTVISKRAPELDSNKSYE